MGAASRHPTPTCPLAPQSTQVGINYCLNTTAMRACMLYCFRHIQLFAAPRPIACH